MRSAIVLLRACTLDRNTPPHPHVRAMTYACVSRTRVVSDGVQKDLARVMSHMHESCHVWMNHVTYERVIHTFECA